MKSTFTVLFYIRKDKQKKNGNSPIHCRITFNGKSTQFNTKTEIHSEQWDASAGKVIGRSPKAQETNTLLDNSKATLFRIYHELQEKGKDITSQKVRNIFFGINCNFHTLIQVFDKHNSDFEQLVGVSKAGSTLQKYKRTKCLLDGFISSKYNLSDISLNDVDHQFVQKFDAYLRVTHHYHQNTVAKHMRRFKTVMIYAKNNEWLHHEPFAKYKICFDPTDRGYLTWEELEVLIQKKITISRLEQVRDVFVFSCYTGLAYIDAKNLTQQNVCTSFDGNLWIMTKRQKTNVKANIPLLDTAKKILDKYSGKLPNNALLPILSNQKMNAYLKEIGDLCGIEKNLTYHCARHSILSFPLKTSKLQNKFYQQVTVWKRASLRLLPYFTPSTKNDFRLQKYER